MCFGRGGETLHSLACVPVGSRLCVLRHQVFGPVRAGAITPTRSHRFLAELAQRGMLQRVYTQNVDGLETRAGVRGTD